MAMQRDDLMNRLMDWTTNGVAISDDGLTLVELDENDNETGRSIEIGGIPTE